MPGSASPVRPHSVPAKILATTGLVMTVFAAWTYADQDSERCRAHSTDTVASVHNSNELNTSTSDTTGTEASPSTILASGTPSSTLFEKMPPRANTDCDTPSMRKTRE